MSSLLFFGYIIPFLMSAILWSAASWVDYAKGIDLTRYDIVLIFLYVTIPILNIIMLLALLSAISWNLNKIIIPKGKND